MSKKLITLYIEFRKSRNSKFLFVPNDIYFITICKLLFWEILNPEKGDGVLLECVIDDLKSEGLIMKQPIIYENYQINKLTFHDVYIKTSDGGIFCRGTSTDRMESYAKAFGEVFERTSLQYNNETCIQGSANQLRASNVDIVDITSFPLPTNLQKTMYVKNIWTEDTIFSWSEILEDGQKLYCPSQLVFFNNYVSFPGEPFIQQPTTHGAGAGYTPEAALYSGVFEIVNRHFFLESWYKKQSPDRVDLDSLYFDVELSNLVLSLKERNFNLTLLSYTRQAKVPSFICVIERWGGYSVGGSAGIDAISSIKKAIYEAFSTYIWSVQTTLSGRNNINIQFIDGLKNNFVDEEQGSSFGRVMLFGDNYFIKSSGKVDMSFLFEGVTMKYLDILDKYVEDKFDISKYIRENFGKLYLYQSDKSVLKKYDYYVKKIIIPNTYYFALNDKYSRPLLKEDDIITNYQINPFP